MRYFGFLFGFLLFLLAFDLSASSIGQASWYGEEYRDRLMANGKRFDPDRLTCASWFHPLGTKLEVQSRATGRSVTVLVTDRGPHDRFVRQGRVIDLSRAAFARIEKTATGLAGVRISVKQSPALVKRPVKGRAPVRTFAAMENGRRLPVPNPGE